MRSLPSVSASLFKPLISSPIAAGCVPAKFTELMLEVLLGFRRDIPAAPILLEFGDKLTDCAHLPMIAEFAAPASSIRRSCTASMNPLAAFLILAAPHARP
jgi:hypothetical protein